MTQLKITLLLLLIGSVAKAQLLTPQTINAAGKSSTNGGIVLEYSLGGTLVSTISTPTFMYTQDFLQSDAGITNTPIFINDVTLSTGSTLDNAGTTFVNVPSKVMIEFTLGEVASITLNSPNNILTQGILQPKSCTPVLILSSLDMPLMGMYQARDEIVLIDDVAVDFASLIFNAPLITVATNATIKKRVILTGVGCQTN